MSDKPALAVHGTYSRYTRGKCRCDACKAAHRDYQRAYRRSGRDKAVAARLGGCVPGLGWPRYPGRQDWTSTP